MRSVFPTAWIGVDGPVVLERPTRCEYADDAHNKCSNDENKSDENAQLKRTSQTRHEPREEEEHRYLQARHETDVGRPACDLDLGANDAVYD